ncbi:hypothetical protein OA93_03115 [Flavobacterium sp. KMS]|nr:hypothetical protein OA93_03115 [Flavobacterium sp. KMS]
MILVFSALFLTFLSYYFGCLTCLDSKKNILFILCFIISSIALRLIIHVSLNNDYLLYYNFQIFQKPNSFFSFLLNEPYLYSVYSVSNFFLDSKENVFLGVYWFNWLISSFFFVWLIRRIDVEAWKKMILFVCYYFILTFVLLRNGPAYILFALYFYYSFRKKNFNWILITPFMHISSCLLLVTFLHKSKYYFSVLVFIFSSIFFFYFFMSPFLLHIGAFESILNKISFYLKGISDIGIMHKIFFMLISFLIITGFVFYKKKMLHPILMTTVFIYMASYYINPIVAFRFSLYVIFALLLYPFNSVINDKKLRLINSLTIFLFPIFVFAMLKTHDTEMFIKLFSFYSF